MLEVSSSWKWVDHYLQPYNFCNICLVIKYQDLKRLGIQTNWAKPFSCISCTCVWYLCLHEFVCCSWDEWSALCGKINSVTFKFFLLEFTHSVVILPWWGGWIPCLLMLEVFPERRKDFMQHLKRSGSSKMTHETCTHVDVLSWGLRTTGPWPNNNNS